MEFLKYPSLTNHYNITSSRRILSYLKSDDLWYATEKIDGTNIVIAVDIVKNEWTVGRRRAFIGRGETSDSQQEVYHMISQEQIDDASKAIRSIYPNVNYYYIYGELFGIKMVRHDYDITKPTLRLYDALVPDTNDNYIQLTLKELQQVIPIEFQEPVVKVGTLAEMLKEEPDEHSHYGGTNEGYVFKLVNGSTYDPSFGEYSVVKFKTKAYQEIKSQKKPVKGFSKDTLDLVKSLDNYVTEQRLHNVLSHGDYELNYQNIGNLIKEFNQDVRKEYANEQSKASLDDKEFNTAMKPYNKKIVNWIKSAIADSNSVD